MVLLHIFLFFKARSVICINPTMCIQRAQLNFEMIFKCLYSRNLSHSFSRSVPRFILFQAFSPGHFMMHHILLQDDGRQLARSSSSRHMNMKIYSGQISLAVGYGGKSISPPCYLLLGLFLDSWILFPQFIAKLETANEERMMIELPTK